MRAVRIKIGYAAQVEPHRLDAILALLRERGGRVTTSRRAIVSELLRRNPDHVTAEQLTDAVQAAHPDVHASTVYRCLDALTELGIVEHVHLGHGPAVYHLTDETHQHLVCEHCNGVIEVPAELFTPVLHQLQADYGFTAMLGHFAIAGQCQACAARADSQVTPGATTPAS